MKTKFINAIIIKDFESDAIFGDLIVEDDKICYVGKQSNIECDKTIDVKNNVIMPGFVNANSNSYFSALSGKISHKKAEDFFCEVNNLSKNLTASDIQTATLFSYKNFAKNGITTVCENSICFDKVFEAIQKTNMRAVVSIKQRYNKNKYLNQTEIQNIYDRITTKSKLISANFCCNSLDYDFDENYITLQKLANKNQTFLSANICQTLEEVGKCATQNDDMSPVEVLKSYGFYDRKNLTNCATNFQSKDIQIAKFSNASVCVMPTNDQKLANGVAPIYQMLQYGVNVCVGTGISAIAGRYDMFEVLRQIVYSQNTLLSYVDSIDSRTLLKMATINGAEALNLKNVGKLEVGFCADLIMLDISEIISQNIFDYIVYSCSEKNILMTMVDGKIIWDGKKLHFAESEQSITKKAKKLAFKF